MNNTDELPQWVLDDLTEIKMAARDRKMSDAEFFELIASFASRLGEE